MNSYLNLSKKTHNNNLLTNIENSYDNQTNISYSKVNTDNASEKSNFSTITSGNSTEKIVRFADNETDYSPDSPDSNI
jgi:hypothetical protein